MGRNRARAGRQEGCRIEGQGYEHDVHGAGQGSHASDPTHAAVPEMRARAARGGPRGEEGFGVLVVRVYRPGVRRPLVREATCECRITGEVTPVDETIGVAFACPDEATQGERGGCCAMMHFDRSCRRSPRRHARRSRVPGMATRGYACWKAGDSRRRPARGEGAP